MMPVSLLWTNAEGLAPFSGHFLTTSASAKSSSSPSAHFIISCVCGSTSLTAADRRQDVQLPLLPFLFDAFELVDLPEGALVEHSLMCICPLPTS